MIFCNSWNYDEIEVAHNNAQLSKIKSGTVFYKIGDHYQGSPIFLTDHAQFVLIMIMKRFLMES